MRHLLSPAYPNREARREALLNEADEIAAKVEAVELIIVAHKHSNNPANRSLAKRCQAAARRGLEQIRQLHAWATNLTDYTNPLDRPSEGWAILSALREEAESRALSPAQLRSAILNPKTTALREYRHAC